MERWTSTKSRAEDVFNLEASLTTDKFLQCPTSRSSVFRVSRKTHDHDQYLYSAYLIRRRQFANVCSAYTDIENWKSASVINRRSDGNVHNAPIVVLRLGGAAFGRGAGFGRQCGGQQFVSGVPNRARKTVNHQKLSGCWELSKWVVRSLRRTLPICKSCISYYCI